MRWPIPAVLIFTLFVAASCDQPPTEPFEQPVEQTVEETIDPPFAAVSDLHSIFRQRPPVVGRRDRWRGDLIWVDIIETTPQQEPWVVFFGTRLGNQRWDCGGPRYYQTLMTQIDSEWYKLTDKEHPLVAYRFTEFFPLFMEGLDLGEDPYCYAAARAEQIAGGETRMQALESFDSAYFEVAVRGSVAWEEGTYRTWYHLEITPDGVTSDGEILDVPSRR